MGLVISAGNVCACARGADLDPSFSLMREVSIKQWGGG